MKAGHGLAKPTAKVIEEESDMLAFLFRTLSMQNKRGAVLARRSAAQVLLLFYDHQCHLETFLVPTRTTNSISLPTEEENKETFRA